MGLAFRGLAVGKPKGCPARGRLFIRCLVRRRRSSLAIDRTKADSNTTGFSVGRRLLLAPLCTWALVVTAIPVADGEEWWPQRGENVPLNGEKCAHALWDELRTFCISEPRDASSFFMTRHAAVFWTFSS